MAPVLELLGVIYTLILIVIGDFSAFYFIALFVVLYLLSILISSFSILYEQLSYNNYKEKKDLNSLIITAFLEPLFIHPKIVYWGLSGHWDFIKGKGGWGNMIRTGFKKSEDKKNMEPSTTNT